MRLLLTTLSITTAVSQDKFRRDYNHVAIYYSHTQQWGEFVDRDNTFILNINESGDVGHIKANGETSFCRKLDGLEEGYSNTGDHYQINSVNDDDGDVLMLQQFDNTTVGLKLIYDDGSVMIQFVWF